MAKPTLRQAIDEWLDDLQRNDDTLDMWISASLVDAMTDAAWAVLQESKNTQEWLKREGHIPE